MSDIGHSWVRSTVLVADAPLQDIPDSFGTGFLVTAALEDGSYALFVVTNKHVFAQTPEERLARESVYLYFQKRGATPSRPTEQNVASFEYMLDGDEPPWREHPDPAVDVMAFDVTALMVEHRDEILVPMLDYRHFALDPSRSQITAGSQLFVIGYPGVASLVYPGRVVPLMNASTFHPIVKWGVAATNPAEDLTDLSAGRSYRGFLIDGLTLPGMSGSPVFLAEARYSFPPLAPGDRPADPLDELMRRFDLAEGPLLPRPPLLVGIVAETRFVDIPDTDWAQMYAGFGLAFNASTIKETVGFFDYLPLAKPYEDQTKKELLEEARAAGIEGRSAMSKAQLIYALRNA